MLRYPLIALLALAPFGCQTSTNQPADLHQPVTRVPASAHPEAAQQPQTAAPGTPKPDAAEREEASPNDSAAQSWPAQPEPDLSIAEMQSLMIADEIAQPGDARSAKPNEASSKDAQADREQLAARMIERSTPIDAPPEAVLGGWVANADSVNLLYGLEGMIAYGPGSRQQRAIDATALEVSHDSLRLTTLDAVSVLQQADWYRSTFSGVFAVGRMVQTSSDGSQTTVEPTVFYLIVAGDRIHIMISADVVGRPAAGNPAFTLLRSRDDRDGLP